MNETMIVLYILFAVGPSLKPDKTYGSRIAPWQFYETKEECQKVVDMHEKQSYSTTQGGLQQFHCRPFIGPKPKSPLGDEIFGRVAEWPK